MAEFTGGAALTSGGVGVIAPPVEVPMPVLSENDADLAWFTLTLKGDDGKYFSVSAEFGVRPEDVPELLLQAARRIESFFGDEPTALRRVRDYTIKESPAGD